MKDAFKAQTGSGSRYPTCPRCMQEVIGKDDGEHGFADRNGANADTWIVAALGRDIGIFALRGHRLAAGQDRRCRLDRKADDDFLARRNAAQDAAGMIAQEFRLAVAHADLVGVLLARYAQPRAKPRPISTPLTALMLIMAAAMSWSSLP